MSEQKFDVVALGELLIDFTANGSSEQGNPLFEANPGGAPCNVLAMLKQLGHSPDSLTRDDLHRMLHFANTAAYLVTTRKGAIRSMPTPEQVQAIL